MESAHEGVAHKAAAAAIAANRYPAMALPSRNPKLTGDGPAGKAP
ncbi:hypothetical protein GCM10007036_44990 [Alsobacter metallidurans]|uniref:Uncharacterized protein n=1 Tax=Alsobacter metallidurans TaxID=340221 RepID=A0A917ID46_9HYPH|nr:hypothetical protein GCM10007036_44990 [Alsobacter metallidurans]